MHEEDTVLHINGPLQGLGRSLDLSIYSHFQRDQHHDACKQILPFLRQLRRAEPVPPKAKS